MEHGLIADGRDYLKQEDTFKNLEAHFGEENTWISHRLCTEFYRPQQEQRRSRLRGNILSRLNICRKKGSGGNEDEIIFPREVTGACSGHKSELSILQRQEICSTLWDWEILSCKWQEKVGHTPNYFLSFPLASFVDPCWIQTWG